MKYKLSLHHWLKDTSTISVVDLRRSVETHVIVRRKITLYLANTELIGIEVRVNPPTPHAQICVRMNTVYDLLHIKWRTACSQTLRP